MRINENQLRKIVRRAINEQMSDEQSIELDCAPGVQQQQAIYNAIARETGLPADKKPDRTLMGEWTWYFDDVPSDEWKANAAIRKQIVSDAYNSGVIRFGSF